jgi:hypothetical protein
MDTAEDVIVRFDVIVPRFVRHEMHYPNKPRGGCDCFLGMSGDLKLNPVMDLSSGYCGLRLSAQMAALDTYAAEHKLKLPA